MAAANDEDKKENEDETSNANTKLYLTADAVTAKWQKAFGDVKRAVVLPVIHVMSPSGDDAKTAMQVIERNVALIQKYKFDGCFVINHGFGGGGLVPIIKKMRAKYGDKLWIGANFLGCIGDEFDFMHKADVQLSSVLDGLWIDNGGVYYASNSNDDEIRDVGAKARLQKYQKYRWNGLYFGGVDFKYLAQINKQSYADVSAYTAKCQKLAQYVGDHGLMDCVCTTGKGTGKSADLDKMKAFRDGCNVNGSKLSIASGVTPENVVSYLPFVDAILVATGISQDFHNFSEPKMKQMRKVIDAYYKQKK